MPPLTRFGMMKWATMPVMKPETRAVKTGQTAMVAASVAVVAVVAAVAVRVSVVQMA
jgi:hypothetical protein